jgi:hypothetical protein
VARNERVVHFCRRPIRCARRRHRARVRRLPGLGVCSGSCAPAQPHCGPAPRTSCYKRSPNIALAPACAWAVPEASCSGARKRAWPILVPRVATAALLPPYPASAALLKPGLPCCHSLLLCVRQHPAAIPREGGGARGSAEHSSRGRHGPGAHEVQKQHLAWETAAPFNPARASSLRPAPIRPRPAITRDQ